MTFEALLTLPRGRPMSGVFGTMTTTLMNRVAEFTVNRFILNYKQLPYTTCWLSYPEIGEVLSAAGVPPTRTQKPFFTVPSIVDRTDGRCITRSESSTIAMYLEKARPSPSIFPEGDPTIQFDYIDFIEEHVYTPMIYMTVPSTTRILDGADLEYYLASRKGFLGTSYDFLSWPCI